MVMSRLSPEDHDLVTRAVCKAERESDGEVVTVVAPRSDSYHDVGLHYAVLAALLVPVLLAALPQRTADGLTSFLFGWNAAPGRVQIGIVLFGAMTLVFLVVRYALAYPPLRMALTPGRTKTRRVHRRAVEMFRVGCELKTRGRTGVLIYLSLLERRAEILADRAIADQVEPEVWGEAMAVLIDEMKAGRPGAGMAQAVDRVGTVLARLLPPRSDNPNELPDRLVEL
jgi:putative membrane protein